MTVSAATAVAAPRPVGQRSVYFTADAAVVTPVFERATLVPGHTLTGPAVIDRLDATTLIYPGDTMRVDDVGNLIIVVQQ